MDDLRRAGSSPGLANASMRGAELAQHQGAVAIPAGVARLHLDRCAQLMYGP